MAQDYRYQNGKLLLQ